MPSQKNFSLTNIQLGEITNPLFSANGINLTTSPTVGGIINSTSTTYKNTINSFSFGGVFSLPLWTTATVLRSCLSAGTGYQLEVVGTTGKFKVTLNATVYESSIPGGGSLGASNLIAGSTHKIICVITVGASTTTVSSYIDGYLLNTTSAQANVDVTNTNVYYTGGLVTTRYAMTVYDVYDYNRALTASEVLDLYNNGINYADKGGSQTSLLTNNFSNQNYTTFDSASVSGFHVISDGSGIHSTSQAALNIPVISNKKYNILWEMNLVSGSAPRFILYGASAGVITVISNANLTKIFTFTASVTENLVVWFDNDPAAATEYTVSDFSFNEIGNTLALLSNNIQPAPGQWLDSSSNKLHAVQPLTGSSLTQPKRDFEIRGTTSWTASHAAQDIVGIAQNVLPPNAYIQSIVGVITGADVEDIIIGDGSDTNHWVEITTGLTTGTVSFTIANHISDGSHEQLVVDPDADCTMSIEWTIKGVIL